MKKPSMRSWIPFVSCACTLKDLDVKNARSSERYGPHRVTVLRP